MLTVSDAWKTAYPGAAAGILAMRNVANPEHDAELERHKEELESQLRTRFANRNRASLLALPPRQAYDAYLSRFKKTTVNSEQLAVNGEEAERRLTLQRSHCNWLTVPHSLSF